MSNDTYEDQELDQGGNDDLRTLRAQAASARQAQTEAATAKRELLFAKAGIDYETNPLGRMIFGSFDGADIDALKAVATEVGYFKAAPAEKKYTPGEETQQEFRQGFGSGTPSGGDEVLTPHPVDAAYENFHLELKQGVPRDRAALGVMDRLIVAGAKGDSRVIFDPVAWQRKAAEYDDR